MKSQPSTPRTIRIAASTAAHGDRTNSYGGAQDAIADLHRAVGNRAVQRLLGAGTAERADSGRISRENLMLRDYANALPPARSASARSPAGDVCEREADRVADRASRTATPASVARRSVAEEYRSLRHQGPVRTSSRDSLDMRPADAPPHVGEALGSHGQSLDASVRAMFEPYFARDFSDVRIHDGAAAQRSTKRLNARAYTIGRDIVFGAGRYTPGTASGRRLIAHELAHVVQQDGGPAALQREIDINDFETDDFDETTIQTYLHHIRFGKIEDHGDSDDKARAVVKRWRKGTIDAGDMDPQAKATLIKEMQSGYTGNDDERAILVILLNSSDAELAIIFGPGGVDPKELDSDFQGDEEDVLRAFFDRKFIGGRKAALSGKASLRPMATPTAPPPGPKIPWRELARRGVPYDQWPIEEKKAAERARKAANKRIFEDTPSKTTPEWWQTRDEDNELFGLQHPYHEQMKDFFQRSTYLRIEISENPVKSGDAVTLTAYIIVPSGLYKATGQIEFTFLNRETLRIYGKDYAKKASVKAPIAGGVARYTIPNVYHSMDVTAIYPDTGNLIGDETGLRLEIKP